MTKADKQELAETLTQMTGKWTGELTEMRSKLIYKMRDLGERLAKAADRLEKRPDDPLVLNALGVIQGDGFDIDRLCALYHQLMNKRQDAAFFIGEVTK